jgi:cell division protein FtsQ
VTAPTASAPAGRPRALRAVALGLLVLAVLASPWWGRAALRRLAYFQVRQVEVRGLRYAEAEEIVGLLRADTTHSVWEELEPWERRVAAHPQVAAVTVERRLPGTLVVLVTERLPVAFVASREGLQAVDSAGRALPIDPSRTPVDVPVIAAADTAVLRLLTELRSAAPAMYRRVSEVRREGKDEVLLRLPTVPVRAMLEVTPGRLADLALVEADLARRGHRVAELDLRYRDQVIARLP